ncbi:unnamed protein product [marine sediment metagenome]|uniref:AmmeMemoRadiSam system protein B n=1 Tax=marine sediment metagenome TaxID=412755 RepID=X0Z5I1_9ZZZZ
MKKVALLLFFFVLIIVVIGLWATKGLPYKKREKVKNESGFIHQQKFYNEGLFQLGVEQVKTNGSNIENKIYGGVIPHDTFPSFMIADFFSSIVKQNPKTIVIFGPNHLEKGGFKVLTSIYPWETTFGFVEPDKELINNLLKLKNIGINRDVLTNEHSVAAIMSFIKYYLPETKVVPLVISGIITESDIDYLIQNISVYDLSDCIFIASVDFSHYLNKQQADVNDAKTVDIIYDFNYQKLLSLSNDYLDSPGSIVTVLKIMKEIDKTNIEILHHKNLQDLTTEDVNQTSSYYTLVFY